MMRRAGFTLLEILMTVSLSSLVLILLGQAMFASSMTFEKVTSIAGVREKTSRGFDRVQEDVKMAAATLAQWPPSGGSPQFVAADDDVLILRQPKFDSDKNPVVGEYKVIIYKLRAAPDPADGPYVLERWTADEVLGSSAPPATFETVAIKNVKSWTCEIGVNQYATGNQYQVEYWFLSTPAADPGKFPTQVLVGGVDRIADGFATVSGQKVILSRPLVYGVVMDLIYHADPAISVTSDGSNGGTSVYLEATFAADFQHNDFDKKTHETTLTAIPRLENVE